MSSEALERPDALPEPGPITVRVADSLADFAALEKPWEALHATARETSVFVSWPWQREWWRAYGGSRDLRIFVAADSTAVHGILPLYVDPVPLPVGAVRLLRWIGTGGDTQPGYLGPMLAPGREPEVARALVRAILARPDWDVLQLTHLDGACPFTARLRRAAQRAGPGLAVRTGAEESSWIVDLPATLDELLQRSSRLHRKRMRHRQNKLSGFAPRFFAWEDTTRVDEAVDRLIELHHLRWKPRGERHAFASPQYVAFHRAVIEQFLRRGWLRLYCLEAAGRIVAMDYCYRFRGDILVMQGGFDPSFARYGVGRMLMELSLRDGVTHGDNAYDLLQGEQEYKQQIATRTRTTVFVRLYRPRAAALAHFWRQECLPAARRRVKDLLVRLGLREAQKNSSTE